MPPTGSSSAHALSRTSQSAICCIYMPVLDINAGVDLHPRYDLRLCVFVPRKNTRVRRKNDEYAAAAEQKVSNGVCNRAADSQLSIIDVT